MIWTGAGIRELTAYLLVAASLSKLHIWWQSKIWDLRVQKVNSWKTYRPTIDTYLGILAALLFLLWGAIEEIYNLIS